MRFWCSQLFAEWSWTPRPYIGVWALLALFVADRSWAIRRARRRGWAAPSRRQRCWFVLGLLSFWIASGWPVGTLGAGYLVSVHMLQYLLYTLVAAPLLLMSVPHWRMQEVVGTLRLSGVLRVLAQPVVAAVTANLILIATHAPLTVDTVRTSQVGSFVLDGIWFVGGLLLWLPLLNPIERARIHSLPIRMIYLFSAAQLFPLIPGGFLTFAGAPLYETYEIAPRIGLDALADQQIAGAIMKVGSLPVVWGVIIVLWARWSRDQRETDRASIRSWT